MESNKKLNKDGTEICMKLESEPFDFTAAHEVALAGEKVDQIERAEDVADGTVMPIAPEDEKRTARELASAPLDDDEAVVKEVNFEDGSRRSDHGRNLV